MTLVKKGAIVLATLVGFQLAIFSVIGFVHLELRRGAERAEHSVALSRAAARALVDILLLTRRATIGRKGAGPELNQMIVQQRRDLNELRALVKNEPDPTVRARLGLQSAAACLDILERGRRLELINSKNLDRLVWNNLREKARGGLADASSVVKFLQDEQARINQIIDRQRWWQTFNQYLLGGGSALEVALAAVFVGLFRHDISRRMQVLIDNSQHLANRQPLSQPLPGTDEIATLDAAFHEVSAALAAAEENEKAIVENALDMICQLDDAALVVQVNAAARELLGFDESELLGREIGDLCSPGERAALEEQLSESRKAQQKPLETRLLRKDGRFVDVSFSIAWAEPDRSFFCVVHDISAIKHAERLRQEVVQMVSHDLKSPLFTVSSYLEMLSGDLFGELTERGKDTVELAFLGCSQMLTLIRDLLDMEKLNAGMLQVDKQPLRLAEVVEQGLELVRSMGDKREVRLEKRLSDESQCVPADRDRLIQIMVNLLSNAIKFSPPGGKVTVAVGKTQLRGKEAASITIVDRGRGIPAEQLPFIFDRFHQVRVSDSKEAGGTGLGLSIVKALVELHEGVVEVESAVGEGASFKVTLPVGSPVEDESHERRPFR